LSILMDRRRRRRKEEKEDPLVCYLKEMKELYI
jgi:ribosomal protein L13E